MSKLKHSAEQLSDLHEYLKYENGIVIWIRRRTYNVEVGRRAGYYSSARNSRYIRFNRVLYLEHHIVWYLCHGSWPTTEIDHINGDGYDNRIENLRESSRSQNNTNKIVQSNNKLGVKNIHLDWGGKYVVQMKMNGEGHTSRHDTLEEAIATRDAVGKKLHGDFYCPGYRSAPEKTLDSCT